MRFDSFRHMLSHMAEERKDAPALIYEDETVSYGEFLRRVTERARELETSGKTCIGILSDGSLDCVTEIFAANLAGLQVVMLDAGAPDELLPELIRYTDIDMLWGDEELCEELEGSLTGGTADGRGKILFFTSGTTERARAVVLTDRSLCQSAYNGSAKLPLTPEDTLLCVLPLGHVFGFVCGMLWGLSCGAAVAFGRGMRHYTDDCAFYRPTVVSLVPMLLRFMMKQGCLNGELKTILIGAGDCPESLIKAASAMGIHVSFGYGLTETSSGVAISVSGDPFAMEICPDDEITIADDGEILIKAPTCMMEGYYKMPDRTAEVLKSGIFHTGDLGYLDEEGRLHVSGRKKEMLVLPDGTKLFLPEYEAKLMKALGTPEVAVILIGGRPALVLGGEADREEIKQKIRAVMAGYPRGQQIAEIIITGEPLPRTAAGKIRRWEIRQKVSGSDDKTRDN